MAVVLPQSRLVGRDEQLDELDQIFEEVRSGRPSTAIVTGEAGIGKSRLIREFGALVSGKGARVVVGHAVPIDGGGPAFTPIVGMLRALVDDLGADVVLDLAGRGGSVLGALVPSLGSTADAPEPRAADRGPLYEVFTSLLERVATDAPLVVVVEDVHWSDAASRDLLRFVVRGLYRAPVMIILSYRSDELHRGHPVRPWLAELERVPSVHRVELPRLDRDAVTAQLGDLLGRPPSTSEAGSVFHRSEGVPFFVEELADSAAASSSNRLPSTVADVLLTRVERLRPDTQRVLRVLSAAGSGIRHELVDLVTEGMDTDVVDDALREAISAGVLVVRDDQFYFRHALLREAVHHDMLPGERARTHAAYAVALESRRDLANQDRCASEVAFHWMYARDDQRAFRWSFEAIDELTAVYAFGPALEAAERALGLWDRVDDPVGVSGGDQVDLLMRAARLGSDAGEVARSLSLTKAALDQLDPDDVERLGSLTAARGDLEAKLGMPGSIATLERARQLTVGGSPMTRARVADTLAMLLMLAGRCRESVDVAVEAQALAHEAGSDPLLSSAHNTNATSLFFLGDTDAALAEFDLARELAGDDPRSLLRYHVNYSDSLMLMRRYADAVDVAMAGKIRAREVGRKRTLGSMLAGNAAEPLIALGEWDRAVALIDRGLELEPARTHVFHLRLLWSIVAIWRDDLIGAAEALELLDVEHMHADIPQNMRPLARVRAELALAHEDPRLAWDLVRDALPTDHHHLIAAYDLAVAFTGARALGAAARLGSEAGFDVAAHADTLRAAVKTMDHHLPDSPWPVLVAAELASPADPTAAVAAWSDAVARVDAPDVEAALRPYSRLRLARAHLDAGDRVAAATALTTAAAEADALGAGLLRRWIDDLARRGRLSIPGSGRVVDGLAGLTTRELEVLRLVAEGRSNREIGADLFISAKTASVHVSNILAKLDVSSRGEAAATARRRGILDVALR